MSFLLRNNHLLSHRPFASIMERKSIFVLVIYLCGSPLSSLARLKPGHIFDMDISQLDRLSDDDIMQHILWGGGEARDSFNKRGVRSPPPILAHPHIRTDLVRFGTAKPHSHILPPLLVKKRSSVDDVLLREVCSSHSDWVTRPEAVDPYGNTVKVMEHIPFNGTLVRQYFYETFCTSGQYDKTSQQLQPQDKRNDQANECIAVDKSKWHSRCRENHVWTYGKVIKPESGEEGWSVIGIRGSCSCAVKRRAPGSEQPRLFIDDLDD